MLRGDARARAACGWEFGRVDARAAHKEAYAVVRACFALTSSTTVNHRRVTVANSFHASKSSRKAPSSRTQLNECFRIAKRRV